MGERSKGVVVAAAAATVVVVVVVVTWRRKQEGVRDGARFLKGGEW